MTCQRWLALATALLAISAWLNVYHLVSSGLSQ